MFKVVLEYDVKIERRAAADPIVGRLKAWEQKTRATLQQEPGPVSYPIRWTSERQRKAFFATKGFGRGIPYKRTGKLAKAWVVDINFQGLRQFQVFREQILRDTGNIDPRKKRIAAKQPPGVTTIITIDNPAHAERYVTGIQQQGFHADTGWLYAPPMIENAVQEAEMILGVS